MATPHEPTECVQPLPWPQVELLSGVMRKLAHDLSNSLVASTSQVDLLTMRNLDETTAAQLQRLRTYLLKPRDVVQRAMASLPALGDRPRKLAMLRDAMAKTADAQGVALHWQLPDAGLDQRLSEIEWCHVAQALCQNALDAHQAARIEGQEHPAPEVVVGWLPGGSGARLEVVDNGPGCRDLHAAATGAVRRTGGGHLGLGLAVVAAMLKRHGGSLTVALPAEGGFRATAELPPR